MDPQALQRILMKFRQSSGPDLSQSPMQSAPMPSAPGLDQAYSQPPMAAAQQQTNPMPMQFDPMLEQQAQGMNNQLEPIVQQIMQHLGLMGMVRNRSNQSMLQ